MSLKSLGSLSCTLSGTGSAAAVFTSAPKRACRLLAEWYTHLAPPSDPQPALSIPWPPRRAALRVPCRRPRAVASTNWPWLSCRRFPGSCRSEISVALRIGGSAFDTNLRPVGVEFLGDDGGDAGVGALSHLEVLGDHRHAVVGTDSEEGVGSEGGAGRRSDGTGERTTRGAGPFESIVSAIAPTLPVLLRNSRRVGRGMEWLFVVMG